MAFIGYRYQLEFSLTRTILSGEFELAEWLLFWKMVPSLLFYFIPSEARFIPVPRRDRVLYGFFAGF